MKSVTTDRFRKALSKLPQDVQQNAKTAYQKWKHNPGNPSLRFKQIHPQKPIYSVRVGLSYRALGIKEESTMIWFWIGSHEDYNNFIGQL